MQTVKAREGDADSHEPLPEASEALMGGIPATKDIEGSPVNVRVAIGFYMLTVFWHLFKALCRIYRPCPLGGWKSLLALM